MPKNINQNSWKETTLGIIADVQTGPFGSQLHEADYVTVGTPIITVEHLVEDHIVHSESVPKVSNEDKARLVKYSLKEGDIVFSRVGSVDRCGYVSKKEEGWLFSGRLLRVRPSDIIDKIYLYYWLSQPYIKSFVKKIAVGATMPSINTALLSSVPIKYPTLSEQRAIAAVLSSYDDKIELLRSQNQTLEALAQAFFKEWFIDFNFPNAQDKPYKKNGGTMIENELGEIPIGWKVYRLNEIVKMINGYSYKGEDLKNYSNEALVTLKSFDRTGGFQTRGFKPFNGNPKQNQEVLIGDLIVSHTDLTQNAEVLGNPAIIFENGGFKKMYITMDLVKIISLKKEVDNGFLYYLMRRREFKLHCLGYANGTTVLHLSKKAIPEYQLPLPSDFKLIEKFSKLSLRMIQKISNNTCQIQNLSNIRNALLPKLMENQN